MLSALVRAVTSIDRQAFDTVEPALVGFEVVRVLVEGGDDAGLEFLEHIGAGADARLPVDAALFRRHDRDVRHDVGEVGIAAVEFEHHRLGTVGDDVLDRSQERFRHRFRALDGVMPDRGHDIVGGNRLAIVKGGAFPQFEHPLLGAV